MEPRLISSTRWTELPPELKTQIEEVFHEKYLSEYDVDGEFQARGWIYPNEIIIQVGIHNPNYLGQRHFIVSMETAKSNEKETIKLIDVCVDFLGELWEEFLEEEFEPPLVWQATNYNKRELYYYYHTTNYDLETEANKLLGEEKSLTHGEWDDLDADEVGDSFDDEETPLH